MANTGTVTLTSGTSSIGYGAIPPLTVGKVYTTNGTSGQFLTSVSNGTSWTNPSTQFNNSNGKPIMTVPAGTDEIVLEKDATLTVKGKVVINDRDLEERLNTIEKVLQIPERDVKLEKKHPKLKKLYDEYIKELAKYRMWNAIKGDDNVA
jgi:predicted transcriptional regulator